MKRREWSAQADQQSQTGNQAKRRRKKMQPTTPPQRDSFEFHHTASALCFLRTITLPHTHTKLECLSISHFMFMGRGGRFFPPPQKKSWTPFTRTFASLALQTPPQSMCSPFSPSFSWSFLSLLLACSVRKERRGGRGGKKKQQRSASVQSYIGTSQPRASP